jgi:hypothetical protein
VEQTNWQLKDRRLPISLKKVKISPKTLGDKLLFEDKTLFIGLTPDLSHLARIYFCFSK